MKRLVTTMIAIVISLVSFPCLAQEVARERFEVDFGGFLSTAEITYPAGEEGPFPAVILIPGSGITDLDHTVVSPYDFGPGGPVQLSANFRALSDGLSQHGFAVVRYNKRYVTGPNQVDAMRFYQLTLADFLADAEAVVEATIAHPKVDGHRLFLFGWSEGSTLAATLAAERSDVAGLILQTPVVFPWKETFAYQVLEVGWPFLLSFAEEGYITAGSISKAMTSDAGMVAKSAASFVVDQGAWFTGQLAVNTALDADQDGRLKIGSELTMSALLELVNAAFEPGGYLAMYAPENGLPPVGDRVGAVRPPVLILQGGRDANVPPRGAEVLYDAFKAAGHPDVTLRMYPELGHSLGEASSVRNDNFRPIAPGPIEDVAAWLKARAGTRP